MYLSDVQSRSVCLHKENRVSSQAYKNPTSNYEPKKYIQDVHKSNQESKYG